MYEKYWKLKVKPFNNTPDPRFLYMSSQYEDAMMKLTYAVVEKMGAAVLTGVFGCGKTLLGRALARDLGEDKYKFVFINNPQVSSVELLRAIVRNLRAEKLPDRRTEIMADSLLEILNEVLLDNLRDGRETVIIVDEAHVIENDEIFEQLRMLLNFQQDDRFLLTLLLFGQPELARHIANLKQFEQRISIRCHLDKLNKEETHNYVAHRLKVAGRQDKIFAPEAIDFIYERSSGIPRRINRICDLSLLAGFGKKVEVIEKGLVKGVVEDFKL